MEGKIRFVSPLDRAIFLKSVDGLQDISARDLATLAQSVEEVRFSKGDVVTRVGERVDDSYLVVDGTLRMHLPENLGTSDFSRGDRMGTLYMLGGLEEGFHSEAISDSVALKLNRDSLMELFEDHFEILHSVLRMVARRTLAIRSQIPHGSYLTASAGAANPEDLDLTLVPRLLNMRRGFLFKRANMDALVEIARAATIQEFSGGTRLWSRGHQSGFLDILIKGKVRCEVEENRIFHAGPGYPLGNLESQASEPRWYDAIVEEPVIAIRNESDILFDIFEDHFDLAADYLAAAASGLLKLVLEERRKALARTTAA